MIQTHLDRVLIVVERRILPGGSYPGFDIRHIEGPLQCTGLVDNIDVFYYSDYSPNCDKDLIEYCVTKKPKAVLLSLQNIALRKIGEPSVEAVRIITHELHIPTASFWFDIAGDPIGKVLEEYRHSVTLNIILGADASSHKTLLADTSNYVYAGITFDERLFPKQDGIRDISLGFLGTLHLSRTEWINRLRETGFSPLVAGGLGEWLTEKDGWMHYEEYLRLLSRLKISLNFSLLSAPQYQPSLSIEKNRVWDKFHWIGQTTKTWLTTIVKNPLKARRAITTMKNTVNELAKKPRYQIRGRVWESLWCRTFLLEEDNPVTRLFFEPYVDYVPFVSFNDLVDKIHYYLDNDAERDRIRLCGRATVEKYHNAKIYWENLFQVIGVSSIRQDAPHTGEIWNKAYFDKWFLKQAAAKTVIKKV